MQNKTNSEMLMERLEKEYFKDLPEDEKEKMMKLVVYMMLN